MDGKSEEKDGGIDFLFYQYHQLTGYYGDLKPHGE